MIYSGEIIEGDPFNWGEFQDFTKAFHEEPLKYGISPLIQAYKVFVKYEDFKQIHTLWYTKTLVVLTREF